MTPATIKLQRGDVKKATSARDSDLTNLVHPGNSYVAPAKAEAQGERLAWNRGERPNLCPWVPAFAGMTANCLSHTEFFSGHTFTRRPFTRFFAAFRVPEMVLGLNLRYLDDQPQHEIGVILTSCD